MAGGDMIQPTFPRTQGALSRETYLTLLLLALVNQAGGELHISAPVLESLDSGGKLLVDWDSANQQVVVRAATGSLVVAEIRGTGWTTTQPAAPPTQPSPPSSHRIMTEDEILSRITQRIQADRMREWREQGASVVSQMPPPEEPRQ